MADVNQYFEPGNGVLEPVLLNLPQGVFLSLTQNSRPFLGHLLLCGWLPGTMTILPPASVLSQGA